MSYNGGNSPGFKHVLLLLWRAAEQVRGESEARVFRLLSGLRREETATHAWGPVTMDIVIEQLNRETTDLEQVGRISDGVITNGEEFLNDVLFEGDLAHPDEILERFNGPTLFARPEESTARKSARKSNVRTTNQIVVDNLQRPERTPMMGDALTKSDWDFREVDDALLDAIQKQVWEDDISKAPVMWEDSSNVPTNVRDFISQAILQEEVLYDEFENVHAGAVDELHGIIKNQMVGPQGWSIGTIANAIYGSFGEVSKDQSEVIARTEISAVLNKSRELAYKQSNYEVEYTWVGPSDRHTTGMCREIKEEIDSRGGHLPMDELQELLRGKAHKYANSYGTPGRVSSWIPHYQCRHTLQRADMVHL